MIRWVVLGLLASGCVLDSDDLCGPNQVIWGDDERCVCAEGLAYTAEGCVACGENELPSPAGCLCTQGFARSGPGAPCQVIALGMGSACTSDDNCSDPAFPHCQIDPGSSGYCTSTGCTSDAACPSGALCTTGASPTYCRKPRDAGKPCTMPADCADGDATFCDTFVSQSCLVQNCDLVANNCFTGSECCDVSAFGLPNLCVAEGACQQ